MRPCAIAVCVLSTAIVLAACDRGALPHAKRQSEKATGPTAQPVSSLECPPSPIPPGVYTKTITTAETHAYARSHDVDYDVAGLDFIVGTWTLYVGVADPNCYYTSWHPLRVDGQVVFVDAHPFTVAGGDRVVFHGAEEPDGLYQVVRHPGYVRLIGLSDWVTRRAAHEIGRWTLVRQVAP